jgi:hypothetical protein
MGIFVLINYEIVPDIKPLLLIMISRRITAFLLLGREVEFSLSQESRAIRCVMNIGLESMAVRKFQPGLSVLNLVLSDKALVVWRLEDARKSLRMRGIRERDGC